MGYYEPQGLAPDRVAIWGEPPGDDVVCHGQRQIAQRFGKFLANWSDFLAGLGEEL